MTRRNCMAKDTIGFPITANTSDFFEKLIRMIISPAFDKEFAQAMIPVEKICQTANPRTAYSGYGTEISPTLKTPDRLSNKKVATLTNGRTTTQKIPTN